MTSPDIFVETNVQSLEGTIGHIPYEIDKQVSTAFQFTTELGVLVLSASAKASPSYFLTQLLARHLEGLDGGRRHV